MAEVITDLKALKLHGMAQAYGELLEQGGTAALQSSHWLIEHLLQAEHTYQALRTLQLALLRRPGGDRVMADVLACVPTFGLEAVLVAVELVIVSGAISSDHVLNVLARLRETPHLTVDTALRLQEEPLADPDRYDQLRHVEVSHD